MASQGIPRHKLGNLYATENMKQARRGATCGAIAALAAGALFGLSISLSVQGHLQSQADKVLFGVTVGGLALAVVLSAVATYAFYREHKARVEMSQTNEMNERIHYDRIVIWGHFDRAMKLLKKDKEYRDALEASKTEIDAKRNKLLTDANYLYYEHHKRKNSAMTEKAGPFDSVDMDLLTGKENYSPAFVKHVLFHRFEKIGKNEALREKVEELIMKDEPGYYRYVSPERMTISVSDAFMLTYLTHVQDKGCLGKMTAEVREKFLLFISTNLARYSRLAGICSRLNMPAAFEYLKNKAKDQRATSQLTAALSAQQSNEAIIRQAVEAQKPLDPEIAKQVASLLPENEIPGNGREKLFEMNGEAFGEWAAAHPNKPVELLDALYNGCGVEGGRMRKAARRAAKGKGNNSLAEVFSGA